MVPACCFLFPLLLLVATVEFHACSSPITPACILHQLLDTGSNVACILGLQGLISYNVRHSVDIEPRQLLDMEVSPVDCALVEYQGPRSLIDYWDKGIFKNLVSPVGQKSKIRSVPDEILGHGEAAVKLQRDWNQDPQSLPFAQHIKTHALVLLVQKGLQYYEIEQSINQVSRSVVDYRGCSSPSRMGITFYPRLFSVLMPDKQRLHQEGMRVKTRAPARFEGHHGSVSTRGNPRRQMV